MKSVYIIIGLFLHTICFGQPSTIFAGGNGNGFSSSENTTSNNYFYKGGIGDGDEMVSTSISNNYLYKGGIGDGFDLVSISTLNNYLYKGGIGDGDDIASISSITNYLYYGGDGDGFAHKDSEGSFIWTGAVSSHWNNAGNWSSNSVPNLTRKTVIPSGVPNYPRVNTGVFAIGSNPNNGVYKSKEVWIQQGAWLITKTNNNVENYGQITIDGNMWVKNTTTGAFQNNSNITINDGGKLTLSPDEPFICGINVSYGGKDYNTVQIGSQCWFAENLDIGAMVTPMTAQLDNNIIEKYCYDSNPLACDIYGGLYRWDEMMQYTTTESTQGICPVDWHLPSDDEIKQLEAHLGMPQATTDLLFWRGDNEGSKMAGPGNWSSGALVSDPEFGTSGFNLKAGGLLFDNGTSLLVGSHGYLWSSTFYSNSSNAYYRKVGNTRTDIYRFQGNTNTAYSVRCVKN